MLLHKRMRWERIIPDNYIARRLIELCNGLNNLDEIRDIIGSECCLEKIFLQKDIKNYIKEWKRYGLVRNNNGYYTVEEDIRNAVRDGRSKENVVLTRILWDITRKCTLRCRHCCTCKEDHNGDEPDTDKIKRAIAELKYLQPYLMVFGGGDPFMRKDFPEILKNTKEIIKCRVKVLSNGALFTRKLVERIKPYVDFIQFGLDGRKETHEFLRNRDGCFERVINAIQLTRSEGMNVGICMTLHKNNVHDVDWIVDFALKHNIHKLKISSFSDGEETPDNDNRRLMPPDEMRELYAYLLTLRIRYKDILSFDFHNDLDAGYFHTSCLAKREHALRNAPLCVAGRSFFYINPEGFIMPCNFIDHPAYFLGNIKEDSLVEIWGNKGMLRELRNLSADDALTCSRCKRKNLCGGGLRCNAITSRNDSRTAGSFCYFFEKNKQTDGYAYRRPPDC